jgi:hypothetical protein
MIICDNQGLLLTILSSIEEAVEWNYITPNVTLWAKWDIKLVILQVYHELAMKFTFLNVKSHQDDAASEVSLSLVLDTRLNIEADWLATSAYIQEDTTRRPIAALFPSAKAQLLIKGKSLTRKLPQTIHFEAGSVGIRTYLKDRNAWAKRTLDNIHWDSHGVSHSFHQCCFLIKLCHGHLPLGQRLHCRDPKYPSTCPGC